jgi:hypothetical protein
MFPLLASVSMIAAMPPPGPVPSKADRIRLNMAAFRKPDSFHWPGHMWIWNDRLDGETLRRQLADMAAHGALSPMPLPEPPEFRPTNMPTRMEPAYLTPPFFAIVRTVADEARRLGLRLWLYDEGGWPSGNACGRLVREHPEFGRQSLRRTERRLAPGESADAPPDCLAAFIVEPDGRSRRLRNGDSVRVEASGASLLVFTVARHGWHADLMNPKATDAFIAMTHEGYRHAAGYHFGTTIPAIFTDEPNMGDMPWTEGFAEEFRRDKGYDLTDRLPSLYEGDRPEDAQVRIDYFDWWSARFASAFFGQCRAWCRDAGILFTGHLNGEDETLGARKHGFGNAMRMMRQMDIPGVDAIWRQLWPGKPNHHFPKFASSVAHQQGTDWAITESFAVYGSGLSPQHMKWIVDYQFVRGINLLDMIGYPYSVADWMVCGERPNYHPQNPLWDALPAFHAYVARLSYLLTLGKPRITTALYFPIRDIWAGGKDAETVAQAHDAAARALLERQCDFDLVDDEAIGAATSRIESGKLHIGAMAYDTMVIARQSWMTREARKKLEQFAASGGTVIALDPGSGEAMPTGSLRVADLDAPEIAGVNGMLRPLLRTETPCPSLRVCVRETGSGTLYFLSNEGLDPLETRLRIPETAPCVRLDPETGQALRLTDAHHTVSSTEMDLRLPFAGSIVLFFGQSLRGSMPHPAPGTPIAEIAGPWTLTPVRQFVVGAENIAVSASDQASVSVSPGDWRPHLGEAFSGEAAYICTFEADPATVREAAWLDLGDVRYACRVELNGEEIGKRLWQPWQVPIRGKLKRGRNTLRIIVTNTLANQYIHHREYERWTPAQLGPYHPRALEFEKDSLSSGLIGPVRLLRAAPAHQ